MVESALILIVVVVVVLTLVVSRPVQELLGNVIQALSPVGSRFIHSSHVWTGEETYV